MDSSDSQTSNQNNTTMQDEMMSSLAAQLGQTTTKLLEKNLSIKPTLGVRPGYRFNVMTTKDIVFRTPYAGLDTLTKPIDDKSLSLTAASSSNR
jgi:type IV secretion system protein VirB10